MTEKFYNFHTVPLLQIQSYRSQKNLQNLCPSQLRKLQQVHRQVRQLQVHQRPPRVLPRQRLLRPQLEQRLLPLHHHPRLCRQRHQIGKILMPRKLLK